MAYLAPSLKRQMSKANTRWRIRDHQSDGWLGDPRHARTKSDHNPDRKGCVHATDVDATIQRAMGNGPVAAAMLSAGLRMARNGGPLSRVVEYFIYDSYIYKRRNNYRQERYDGSNKHSSHLHTSIRHTVYAELYAGSWGFEQRVASRTRVPPKIAPAISLNKVRNGEPISVKRVQARLNAKLGTKLMADGIFGSDTKKAYAAWERRCGHKTINGYPDSDSLKKLGFRVSA